MQFLGTYGGIVEVVDSDPEQIGRLKVRVPAVYGPAAAKKNSVATDDLPWAFPAGLPAGGTEDSGAMVWLPNVGDSVWVRFLDGLPEQPIWEWGAQTRPQAKKYPYWNEIEGYPPKSTYMTRYGHTVSIAKEAVQIRLANGYFFNFLDSGQLEIYVPELSILADKMKHVGSSHVINVGDLINLIAPTLDVKVQEAVVDAANATIKAALKTKVDAPRIELGPEGLATDSVVRLSDLQLVIAQLILQFSTHVHVGNLGRPTSPPTKPLVLIPTGSSTTYTA